jgi:hypothetical protein
MRLILVGLMAVAACSGQKAPKPPKPDPAQRYPLPDQTVETPLGSFVFSGLTLGNKIISGLVMHSSATVTGTITNNTTATWESISFTAALFNLSGGVASDSTFTYMGLAAGKTSNIEPYGGSLADGQSFYIQNGPAAALGIRFRNGSVAVQYSFRMIKPSESTDLRFEDADIESGFVVARKGINFIFRNKTDDPIKIDWNQVSYIDATGTSHPVTHTGVKYTDAAASKPPSTIPPSAKFEDSAIPADSVHFVSGQYGGWETRDLLPRSVDAPLLKGGTVALYMPMEVRGKVKNYLFRFQITDVAL